jgi:hypothetical protein
METTRCFKCRLRKKSGAGAGRAGVLRRRSRAGHQVLIARPREFDHLAIYYLLAGETDLAKQPPDGGMEPEDAADQFFGQGEEPVATAHVEDLMAEDSLLRGHVEFGKLAGRSTAGRRNPKVTGLEMASEHGCPPLRSRGEGAQRNELRRRRARRQNAIASHPIRINIPPTRTMRAISAVDNGAGRGGYWMFAVMGVGTNAETVTAACLRAGRQEVTGRRQDVPVGEFSRRQPHP